MLSSAPIVNGFLKLGRQMLSILIILLECLRKSAFTVKLLGGVFIVQIHGVKNNSKYIGFRERTIFPKYFPSKPQNRMITVRAAEKRHHTIIFEIFSRFDRSSEFSYRKSLRNSKRSKRGFDSYEHLIFLLM